MTTFQRTAAAAATAGCTPSPKHPRSHQPPCNTPPAPAASRGLERLAHEAIKHLARVRLSETGGLDGHDGIQVTRQHAAHAASAAAGALRCGSSGRDVERYNGGCPERAQAGAVCYRRTRPYERV